MLAAVGEVDDETDEEPDRDEDPGDDEVGAKHQQQVGRPVLAVEVNTELLDIYSAFRRENTAAAEEAPARSEE